MTIVSCELNQNHFNFIDNAKLLAISVNLSNLIGQNYSL